MKTEFQDSSRFAASPDVSISVIDGEAALLNVSTGAYFGLNAVGTFIWQTFTAGKTFGETVQGICREFSVDAARAAADARAFTQKILDRGLLRLQ